MQLREFRDWMLQHRGAARTTVELYSPIISALRAFVRYLSTNGGCPATLVGAIPTVAHWRLSALPRYLPSTEVERVIAGCSVSTAIGRRDGAILLLLSRLGLRAGDVAAPKISDVDWQNATIRVSGKGRREVRLPLSQEVGESILAYLEHGRPQMGIDRLFLRALAPCRPFADSSTVSSIVANAIRRAGVLAPFYGAHLLRHSAATEMLQQGASLHDIGTILRHRSIESTALYAKVDLKLLRLVVQPWPGVETC